MNLGEADVSSLERQRKRGPWRQDQGVGPGRAAAAGPLELLGRSKVFLPEKGYGHAVDSV